MSWKQYGYAVLIAAGIALGIVIVGHVGGNRLGAAHVIVGCILTALMVVKTTKAAELKR
jgi:hypothetical protein